MAAKLLRLGWERQPVGPVGINWGHPRAEGLAFFAPLSAAHGTRDLVAEQLGTRTGLEAYLPSQAGAIHHLFGTSNFVDFPTVPSAIGSTTPFTVAWTQEPRSTTGYATPLLVNFGSGTNQFVIYQAASDASYAFVVGPRAGGNSPSFSSSIGLQVNERLDRYVLQALAGSQSLLPADYVLWRNGVRFTTSSTVSLGLVSAAIFRVGARDAGSDPFEGLIGDLRMWSRVLSDGEAEAESTLPEAYALYEPQRIWVPVSAGSPGSYTLSAESASFTLTGNSAGTVAARQITADQASFSLTGLDAGLARGFGLIADTGSFSLAGQATGLTAQRLLTADQATYSLVGNDAGLTYSPAGSYTLTADAGSFSLTGNDATLTYTPLNNYTLTAETGAFTLSGQAAGLTWSGEPVPEPVTVVPAGRPRKQRRFVVEVDGQDFLVANEAEAVQLLELAEQAAKERAQEAIDRASKAEKRPVRKVIADARKATKPPVIVAQQFPELVSKTRAAIEEIQREALQSIEILALIRKREQEEQDDEEVLLLL